MALGGLWKYSVIQACLLNTVARVEEQQMFQLVLLLLRLVSRHIGAMGRYYLFE